jgi:RsiW-degrading membrane proteinase PrsW (M82 family)
MITPNFLAVALTAAVLPFRYNTFFEEVCKMVSFQLPMALAAFLSAIFRRLLPFGTLLLIILPVVLLLCQYF